MLMTQTRPHVTGRQPDPPLTPRRRWMSPLRRWLTTGTSYMIPFVVTGGILLSLAAVLGGPAQSSNSTTVGLELLLGGGPAGWWDTVGPVGLLHLMGTVTIALLMPVLAGFVAYAMAGSAALVAGMVGGLLAVVTEAGYLGGMVAGLLAGGCVLLLRRVRLPPSLDALASVIGVPLLSSLVVGVGVVAVIGPPISELQDHVLVFLGALSGVDTLLLGAVLGLMMCFDIGGPVNKIAFTFALTSLAQGDGSLMAAVMAAGMSAPLGLATATVVRPSVFAPDERTAGKAAWVLGASFVTEGAIPFLVADPLRVLPSVMLGGALAGAISLSGHVSTSAAHGGVWFLLASNSPLTWLGAVVTGSAVTTVATIIAKAIARRR